MLIEVGSFQKSTGGAPVSQTVTLANPTLKPTFMILWTIGNGTAGSAVASHKSAFGFSAGGVSRSHAFASEDAAASSNTSQRGAEKALSIVEWAEALNAEADLTSFAPGQINLNWTTNDANAYHIGYLVGDTLQAKVVEFTIPTAAGDKVVSTVGFRPDLVMMVGGTVSASLPSSIAGGDLVLAAFDAQGNQWCATNRVDDNAATMQASFLFSAGADLMTDTSDTVTVDGFFRTMDPEGFTLGYRAVSGTASRRYALCLRGGSLAAGIFAKAVTAAPVMQRVKPFSYNTQIRGIFFGGIMGQRIANVGASGEARYGIGAADQAGHEIAVAVTDQDNVANANVDAIFKTTKAYIDMSNNTTTIDAEADAPVMSPDGSFSIPWTTNDGTDTRIGFVAFAEPLNLAILDEAPAMVAGA